LKSSRLLNSWLIRVHSSLQKKISSYNKQTRHKREEHPRNKRKMRLELQSKPKWKPMLSRAWDPYWPSSWDHRTSEDESKIPLYIHVGVRAYPGRPFMTLDSCNQFCTLRTSPQAFFPVQYKTSRLFTTRFRPILVPSGTPCIWPLTYLPISHEHHVSISTQLV
jgi:hypothetical protein